jgi:Ca2+-binding RTX toxin-like protein
VTTTDHRRATPFLRKRRVLGLLLALLVAAGFAVACQPGPVYCEGRVATVVGTTGDDDLTGTAGADVIAGLAGDDDIRALGGDDIVCGDAAAPGDDEVDGGPGSDWVAFDQSGSGGTLDLAAGTSRIQGVDELTAVENAVGGPATDQLRGNDVANHFYAGNGDIVEGRGGADRLEASCTGCRVAVSYRSAPGPVTVDAAAGKATGAAGTDTITFPVLDIEGGPFGDTITCDAAGPKCSVLAGAGNDTVTGTPQDDSMEGNLGSDRLFGGGGTDTTSFAIGYTPVTVNLTTGIATGQGTDTLSSFEKAVGSYGDDVMTAASVSGSVLSGLNGDDRLVAGAGGSVLEGWSGDDTLIGSDQRDRMSPDGYGTPGSDTVDARGGDDHIEGDFGDDDVEGGPGVDTLDFTRGNGAKLQLDLATGEATGYGTDTLGGVENVNGGGFADTILGSDGRNVIDGGGGADTVIAQGGDDVVFLGDGDDWAHGGTGNDLMSGDKGNDTLYGGPDVDTVSFRYSWPGVTADLTQHKASGPSGDDRINEFEDLAGAEGNDTLTGDPGPNVIEGSSGIDTCTGGGGADVYRNCP